MVLQVESNLFRYFIEVDMLNYIAFMKKLSDILESMSEGSKDVLTSLSFKVCLQNYSMSLINLTCCLFMNCCRRFVAGLIDNSLFFQLATTMSRIACSVDGLNGFLSSSSNSSSKNMVAFVKSSFSLTTRSGYIAILSQKSELYSTFVT